MRAQASSRATAVAPTGPAGHERRTRPVELALAASIDAVAGLSRDDLDTVRDAVTRECARLRHLLGA